MKNVILLDSEGKRVAVKYFSDDWPGLSAKLAFEKSIFTKTHRTGARSEGIFKSNRPWIILVDVCKIFSSGALIFSCLHDSVA